MRKFIARFRQAPVFSTVYVLGAALSVASVMLVAIFIHVKSSAIYPETTRSDTRYFKQLMVELDYMQKRETNPGSSASFSANLKTMFGYETALPIIGALDSIGCIASYEEKTPEDRVFVDRKRFDYVTIRRFGSEIFKIYDYNLLDGSFFTAEDVEVGSRKVLVSDRFARKVFGTDKGVIGREIELRRSHGWFGFYGQEIDDRYVYKVCGVFEEGSRLLPESFAEVIAPANSIGYNSISKTTRVIVVGSDGRETEDPGRGITGLLTIVCKAPSGVSDRQLREVADDVCRRIGEKYQYLHNLPVIEEDTFRRLGGSYSNHYYNTKLFGDETDGGFKLSVASWPRSSLQLGLGDPKDPFEEYDVVGFTKLYGVLILILLLVPAMNLSGLISGNMDAKMSEMGIRKAFGARRSTLLRQVLVENLWLTGCGALIGVILAWIGVMLWKDWLFVGPGSESAMLSTGDILLDPAMLFAPAVFLAAVVVCFVLNLLASLIPAWWALRKPAIDAIRTKS